MSTTKSNLKLLPLAVLAALTSTLPAVAQTKAGNATMFVLEGSCDKLTIGKLKLADFCAPKILNTSYADGRTGFYFNAEGKHVITFSGMDGKNPTPDTDVVNLDKVILGKPSDPNNPDVFPAKGTCKYGNPYKGTEMTITCSGKLADGRSFSATFTTNGKPPT